MELAVTMSVIVTLAAVAMPAIHYSGRTAENLRCVSNLRQIGIGVVQYANDHSGRLPGPLYAGQYPWWGGSLNGGDPTQLASYIVPYLELNKTRTKRGRDDVFVCPAYKRAVNNKVGSSPVYRLNVEVLFASALSPQAPFGYPNSQYPGLFMTSTDFQPMSIVALSDIVNEQGEPAQSTTWALKDLDESDPIFARHAHEYGAGVPKTKVHGGHRNALFFDFHVGPVD